MLFSCWLLPLRPRGSPSYTLTSHSVPVFTSDWTVTSTNGTNTNTFTTPPKLISQPCDPNPTPTATFAPTEEHMYHVYAAFCLTHMDFLLTQLSCLGSRQIGNKRWGAVVEQKHNSQVCGSISPPQVVVQSLIAKANEFLTSTRVLGISTCMFFVEESKTLEEFF
ncbi:hypothetical protein L3X38_031420 [Prunus dulcis]|uniref:Uncharacterized protein n=1 Tax=Prunus dulcis TaxID=3755 RepID=A0AAD4VD66_PRUDU|nr:hypothetical protein L3X38_031420 [Prunus dulcis]